MRVTALLLVVSIAACVESDDDFVQDQEAIDADAGEGKADGVSFGGLYVTHATHHYNGDVTALELRAEQYVRERCYHASCALPIAETDRFDTYTSSAGKTYVRFWSFTVSRDANDERVEEPTIADVYEIQKTSYGVRLRKSYSSRWMALYRTTPAQTCAATDGTWGDESCTCPLNTSNTWPPAQVFVPGAGGCVAFPGASEEKCDETDGMWTDDDATLIGSYCRCGLDRHEAPGGACVDI